MAEKLFSISFGALHEGDLFRIPSSDAAWRKIEPQERGGVGRNAENVASPERKITLMKATQVILSAALYEGNEGRWASLSQRLGAGFEVEEGNAPCEAEMPPAERRGRRPRKPAAAAAAIPPEDDGEAKEPEPGDQAEERHSRGRGRAKGKPSGAEESSPTKGDQAALPATAPRKRKRKFFGAPRSACAALVHIRNGTGPGIDLLRMALRALVAVDPRSRRAVEARIRELGRG